MSEPLGSCADLLHRFASDFTRGAVDDAAALLTNSYWDYEPRDGEQTQAQAFAEVMASVRSGMPDATLALSNLRPSTDGPDTDGVVADAVLAGHYSGPMFGVRGLGQPFELRAVLRARCDDGGRLAIAVDGVQVPAELRTLGVIPYLSFAHLPPEQPSHLPEVLYRLAFGGNTLTESSCAHLDDIAVVEVQDDSCTQCVAMGAQWPALRQCLTCGHVGCCDLSVNKHARAHSDETGHPLVRSITPGESWIWCYPDGAILSSWHLQRTRPTT